MKEDLYAISQMRANYLLEVFDIFVSDDDWSGVNLNKTNVLFTIFVSIKNIKKYFRL